MQDIREEYKVNRLRGLMQMIQTGEAQEGRGQNTWVQEALVKELNEDEPCLEIIKEMKEILTDIGIEREMTDMSKGQAMDSTKGGLGTATRGK